MAKWSIDNDEEVEAYAAVVARDGSLVFLDDDQTIKLALTSNCWSRIDKIDD